MSTGVNDSDRVSSANFLAATSNSKEEARKKIKSIIRKDWVYLSVTILGAIMIIWGIVLFCHTIVILVRGHKYL